MNVSKLKVYIYNSVVVVLLVCGVVYAVLQFVHVGRVEYTDNARVCRHIAPQNVRVQGFIKEIRFEAYQSVCKGDTLVVLEDAEYRLRLAQAQSDLARAEQNSKATGRSIRTTTLNMGVTDASIDEARVNMEKWQRDDERYANLLQAKAATQQQYDQVHTAYLGAKARYEQLCQTRSVQANVAVEQEHHLSAAEAALQQAQAAVDLARLNLSYYCILATHSGVVGARDINVGQLVNPGQTLLSIVDDSDLWVEANYRESQLQNIHVGSSVTIRVDAVPDEVYKGIVERLSDATGSAFSLLPVDNATGNFVKVEQRLPVRIALEGNTPEALSRLRAGYSVECDVAY